MVERRGDASKYQGTSTRATVRRVPYQGIIPGTVQFLPSGTVQKTTTRVDDDSFIKHYVIRWKFSKKELDICYGKFRRNYVLLLFFQFHVNARALKLVEL